MNTELLPFQTKRKRTVTEQSPQEAIFKELYDYYAATFPTYDKETVFVPPNSAKDAHPPIGTSVKLTLIGAFTVPSHISLSTLAHVLAPVCSPQQKGHNEWSLSLLEAPVLVLYSLKKILTLTDPLAAIPHPYRAAIRDTYTSKAVQENLAHFLSSKKRSKKYLRIFQKRLGIYHSKKPPFIK